MGADGYPMNIEKACEILGLGADASLDDVRLAYRDLVNVWHPDRFQQNPRLKEKAEQQLQEINQAYETVLAFRDAHPQDGSDDHSRTGGRASSRSHSHTGPDRKPAAFFPAIPDWLVRFLARSFDGIVFALMLEYVGVYRIFHHTAAGRLVYVFFLTLVWAFVEANIISSVGTTPGKWLFGVRVVTRQGKRPVLLEAFKRSIGVWRIGLGAGLLPLMPLTLGLCWIRSMKDHPMTWDRTGGFFVIREPREHFMTVVALAAFVLGSWLLIR